MEMIERVARAICDGHTHGNADYDEIPQHYRDLYLDAAKCAIEAMREPTEAMRRAGDFETFELEWPMIIDAALQESEGKAG